MKNPRGKPREKPRTATPDPPWVVALNDMERRYPEWEVWLGEVLADDMNPDWVAMWDAAASVGYDEPPNSDKLVALIQKLARSKQRSKRKPQ